MGGRSDGSSTPSFRQHSQVVFVLLQFECEPSALNDHRAEIADACQPDRQPSPVHRKLIGASSSRLSHRAFL